MSRVQRQRALGKVQCGATGLSRSVERHRVRLLLELDAAVVDDHHARRSRVAAGRTDLGVVLEDHEIRPRTVAARCREKGGEVFLHQRQRWRRLIDDRGNLVERLRDEGQQPTAVDAVGDDLRVGEGGGDLRQSALRLAERLQIDAAALDRERGEVGCREQVHGRRQRTLGEVDGHRRQLADRVGVLLDHRYRDARSHSGPTVPASARSVICSTSPDT